jgi:hypothetical protein
MNKWKILGIVFGIILLLVLGYFAFNYTANYYYQKGAMDGQLALIQNIQSSGSIPYFSNATGTIQINTISIPDLCGSVIK